MGGRGASSGISGGRGISLKTILNASANASIINQAQTQANNNIPINPNGVNALTSMTDDQLTALYMQSKNIDMPNHLKDASDATQKFVYTAGLNAKPLVLDDASFNQYLKDNNIPQSEVMARTSGGANYTVNGTTIKLSPDQTLDMIRNSSLNYIGGKHGGNLYGSGTYFDMNGGRSTGYGRGNTKTAHAVLSPNARTISRSTLKSKTATYAQSHPKLAKAVGAFSNDNASIYALVQGYNVITDGGTYHNVIDRSALVMSSKNY